MLGRSRKERLVVMNYKQRMRYTETRGACEGFSYMYGGVSAPSLHRECTDSLIQMGQDIDHVIGEMEKCRYKLQHLWL